VHFNRPCRYLAVKPSQYSGVPIVALGGRHIVGVSTVVIAVLKRPGVDEMDFFGRVTLRSASEKSPSATPISRPTPFLGRTWMRDSRGILTINML